MVKKIRKAALVAAMMAVFMLTFAVSAYADLVSIPRKADVDCEVIGSIAADGAMTVKAEVMAEVSQSINYTIKGDALDPEFWNQSDAYVEIDLTLETESSTVFAILPAFGKGWKWVNPSVWDTKLQYGKTVTLREPLSTYYSSFKEADPMTIRLQIGSTATSTETVQISVSGLRFVGVGSTPATTTTTAATTTTTAATTTTEATTTTTAATTTTPAEAEPVVTEPEESEPADTEATEPTESEPEESKPADTTASQTTSEESKAEATTAATSPSTTKPATTFASAESDDPGSPVGMIIVIVIVAVVITAGAIVGYTIYKKKKYY